ncbi:hypothetical protein Hanom_Chr04g00354851 [Helianthus anomalus]
MSSFSNSSWSVNRTPNLFQVDLDGNLCCDHEIVVVLRMAGPKSNKSLLEENKMLKSQIRGKKSMWKQPFVFTMFFCHCHMDVHVEVVI